MESRTKITAVVFDLDDTLYDEREYCRSGFGAVAQWLAQSREAVTATEVFDALWGQFESGNRRRTFNAALEQLGLDYESDLIAQLVRVYREHRPVIGLPQASRRVLDELSGAYTLGLLTDGFLPAQRLKVEALEIERYFAAIVYTEELGREFWKPSPVGFERLLEMLGANPRQTVYVADNAAKDFIAPNRLGMRTVQVLGRRRLHTDGPAQPDGAAEHTIDSPIDLIPWLRRQ